MSGFTHSYKYLDVFGESISQGEVDSLLMDKLISYAKGYAQTISTSFDFVSIFKSELHIKDTKPKATEPKVTTAYFELVDSNSKRVAFEFQTSNVLFDYERSILRSLNTIGFKPTALR